MPIDPVCGMTVDPQTAAGSYEHKGEPYYFCSTHCLHKFRANPESILNKTQGQNHLRKRVALSEGGSAEQARPVADAPGSDRTLDLGHWTLESSYTCPMHPEIVRDAPGSCPICGMALEPTTATLEEEDNPELVNMSRRFWECTALTLPLLAIGMSELLPEIELDANARVGLA